MLVILFIQEIYLGEIKIVNSIKYSIIIPIYETDLNFLKQCIESAVNQKSIFDFEILLINDGSKNLLIDELCYEYSKKYKNIRYFFNANNGVSFSRNFGVSNASGEFLIFLDADDILVDQCLMEIDKCINNDENVDLIRFGNVIIDYKSKIIKNNNFLDSRRFQSGVVWGKVFRKKTISDNCIKFNESLKLCEDSIFLNEFCKFKNGTIDIFLNLYQYRFNKRSTIRNFNLNNHINVNNAVAELLKYNDNLSVYEFAVYSYVNLVLKRNFFHKSHKIKNRVKIASDILNSTDYIFLKSLNVVLDSKKNNFTFYLAKLLKNNRFRLAIIFLDVYKKIKKIYN